MNVRLKVHSETLKLYCLNYVFLINKEANLLGSVLRKVLSIELERFVLKNSNQKVSSWFRTPVKIEDEEY